MKSPPTTAGNGGGSPTSTAAATAIWSSPFASPQSYTSRPADLHLALCPWREFFSLTYSYSASSRTFPTFGSIRQFNSALVAPCPLPLPNLPSFFLFLALSSLYFSRDSPIVLFGRAFDDCVVAAVLGLVTIIGVGLDVLVALLVSVIIIGVFRNSVDLYVDEESIGEGRLALVAGSQLLRSFAWIG